MSLRREDTGTGVERWPKTHGVLSRHIAVRLKPWLYASSFLRLSQFHEYTMPAPGTAQSRLPF